ncbi:MAG: bifunctional hydroxymethylpyrimidine kinase/phosphomethylpyrimidine kinase [Candidatus Zixiibacteriota bacterium]
MNREPLAVKLCLTIAGSDSGAGAGIQADLKTFAALGTYGCCVITAVTAQNTKGVDRIFELPPDIVGAQIDSVFDDFKIEAVKTGMLASSQIVEIVAQKLRDYQVKNLVVDPVMISKNGTRLLKKEAEKTLVEEILPLATIITPNLFEAELLSGVKIASMEDSKKAAEKILSFDSKSVVIKGGHSEGAPIDLFYDGREFRELASERIDTKNDHGVGCTFSAAIAALLAKGEDLWSALTGAKEYITEALTTSYSIGSGHSPVNHFYNFYPRSPDKQA